MKTHLSINVADVSKSVDFYKRIFRVSPQKQTDDYAKFDLSEPALNFTMQSGEGREISRVNHFGIEVANSAEVRSWELRLIESGVLTEPENNTSCCFARQDKVWFQDPDGNAWEVFVVLEQIPTTEKTGMDKPPRLAKACC